MQYLVLPLNGSEYYLKPAFQAVHVLASFEAPIPVGSSLCTRADCDAALGVVQRDIWCFSLEGVLRFLARVQGVLRFSCSGVAEFSRCRQHTGS